MDINNKLLLDIESYCKINELNTEEFVNDLLKRAFMIEKYGEKPPFMVKSENTPKKVEIQTIVGTDMNGENETVPEDFDDKKYEEKVTEVKDKQETNEYKLIEKPKRSKKRKLS